MTMTANQTLKDLRIELGMMEHLDDILPLFDAYRVFYGQASNLPVSRHFLFDRILNHESVIYVAYAGDKAVGFVQLFPSFTSVHVQPLWVLNDLYVDSQWRRQGIAKALIQQAETLVRDRNDWGLILETAKGNSEARALYESLGFVKDTEFDRYSLKCQ